MSTSRCVAAIAASIAVLLASAPLSARALPAAGAALAMTDEARQNAALLGGGSCPSFASIAQPSVAHLDVEKYQGIWYEVAIHDNGQPGFCDCSYLNWTLSGDGKSFVDVYGGRCFGKPFHLPLHGRTSNDSSTPGFLYEGFTLGTAVPNMVFNITTSNSGDYYDFSMVLSCLGGWPLGQAFQLLSRQPHVPLDTINALLASAAAVVGEDLIKQVKPMNMSDSCGFR